MTQSPIEQALEDLQFISDMKSDERIKKDVDAMLGTLCPSYEDTLSMMYRVMKSKANNAITALRQHQQDGGWLPIDVTDDLVRYIRRYGGFCRDCADENGICPTKGLPCDDSGSAIRHVLTALNYGMRHGFLTPPAPKKENDDE